MADEAAEVLFVRRVLPLLHEKCLACHGGGESQEGGLDLRSLAGLLKGGDSEHPAVVPLQPDQSPLYLAVARRDDDLSAMPPKQ
ncbi:MAG: c-type cytochrome domain-containing protein, partial [Pirellulales bacterium]